MIAPKDGKTFRDMMTGGGFYYGAELVTTRGFTPPEQPNKLVQLGEQLAGDPRIGWLSLTDNPGGNTMLPPDWLARMLGTQKAPIVLHLTCKDLNRNALESVAWKYAAEGFENILAMTGDYPKVGFSGNASPVFDLDSVGLIALLKAMNQGLQVPGRRGETNTLPKTNFFIGCGVSPFKRYERELMPQYYKLLRKVASGAQYVYTQLGYDMRKFYEIKLLLASHGMEVPVIGNVYLLNKTVADLFHRNQVPGCVVTDKLMEQIAKYAAGPDKGKSFFFDLAAKQLAVFKGLGFAGGYVGGTAKAETFFEIIDRAESFGENDWKEFAKEIQYPHVDEFYLFEQDPETGVGDVNRINRQYLESLENPAKSRFVTLDYQISRLVHKLAFTPDTPGFKLIQRIYARWEKQQGVLPKATHVVENLSKMAMYGCRDCGDCSLPDCGYMCPMASCSKAGRNGPCGGSHDGRCELDDKECIWARAYDRLKYYKESKEMLKAPPVFYNADLKGTSGWANFFLGRNHHHVAVPKSPETPKEPQKDEKSATERK